MPQSWSPSAKKMDKSLYFQYIVEIKQPYMTKPNHLKKLLSEQ